MPRYPKQDDPKGKRVVPSVTEIISDCTDSSGPLTQWAANMCKEWILENAFRNFSIKEPDNILSYTVNNEQLDEMRFNFRKVSQKALDIGSEVHQLIERYLKGKIQGRTTSSYVIAGSIQNEQAQNAFIAFSKWEEDNNLKPIALEQTVYGEVDGYEWGGTMDIECYLDGVKTLIDVKTSADFYWDSMGPQIAAYKSETDAERNGILRLDKKSGMPFYRDRTKYYERDLEIFKTMFRLYVLRHPKIAKGCYNG